MAWFMCEECGARVDAADAPATCGGCGKASMLPAEGLRARKTFEEIALPALAAQPTLPEKEQPALASVTTQVEEGQPAAPASVGGPLIKPRTLELDEQDLVASPAPPPSPALAPRTTDELTENDLVEEPAQARPAARERRPTGPLPPPFHGERRPATGPFMPLRPRPPTGQVPPQRPPPGPAPIPAARPRVATLPLGSKPPTGPVAPWSRPPTGPVQPLAPVDNSPVEIEKLIAVAAPLPPPPRPLAALANQTERVTALRGRSSRVLRVACLFIVVGVVLGGAGYLLGTRRGAVVPPLAARPDLAEPTLRIVQPSPDLAGPPSTVGTSPSQPVRSTRPTIAAVNRLRRPAAQQESAASLEQARAAYQEGLRRLLQGDGPGAVQLFNESLQKSGRFSLAYRGLGLAYEKMGRNEMARASFGRYLLLQPGAEDAPAIRQRIERLR